MNALKGDEQPSLNKLVNSLSKDYEDTVSDFKNNRKSMSIGKKALITTFLAAYMVCAGVGCPWNKKHDRDTTSGSSGTPTTNSAPFIELLDNDNQFDDGVEPNVGNDNSDITFKVNCKDEDNDALTVTATAKSQLGVETAIALELDATNPLTSTYITGKRFIKTAKLPAGIYQIKYEVTDGDKTATLPYANHLIILSNALFAAFNDRTGRLQIYLNGAGTAEESAPYPNAIAESNTLYELIRDATASDVVVQKALEADFSAEQRKEVLEAHCLIGAYKQMVQALAGTYINGIKAAQTPENIPVLDIRVLDLETLFKQYTAKLDILNKKRRDTLGDNNGNQINQTFEYIDEELARWKILFNIALAINYAKNGDKGYTTILPSGELDTPYTPQ